MKIKQVITACLLAFVVTSLVLIVRKDLKPVKPAKKTPEVKSESTPAVTKAEEKVEKKSAPQFIAYYFYGNRRCDTCRAIESNTSEALNSHFSNQLKSGLLQFKTINVEKPEHEHFITDYKLTTRSVVLSLLENDKETKFKNLTEVWSFAGDRVTFIEYVKTELNEFMDVK
ncbi:MAG: nitrophenyl compound nitroreductase subunit ArsF family protein [Planctomycetota bacterium]|jgi:hypothetical protein